MRTLAFTVAVACAIAAAPAHSAAQSSLGKIMKRVEQKKEIQNELRISEADERALGEDVSQKIRTEFGVFQDRDVTKYVTLVGTVMARQAHGGI
jgi:predicted Zn-dependent protease